MRFRGTARHDALHFVPFVVNQPREHVNFVNGGIGDGHRGGIAVGDAVGAVRALDNHRRAELAGVEQFLDLTITPVIAAHETNLYEMFPGFHFRFDNFAAVGGGVGERLFAEYGLSGLDSGDNGAFVELSRRRDHDGVYIGVGDSFVKVLVLLGTGAGDFGAFLQIGLHHVAHRHDTRSANAVLYALNVFAGNHAAAYHANSQFIHTCRAS